MKLFCWRHENDIVHEWLIWLLWLVFINQAYIRKFINKSEAFVGGAQRPREGRRRPERTKQVDRHFHSFRMFQSSKTITKKMSEGLNATAKRKCRRNRDERKPERFSLVHSECRRSEHAVWTSVRGINGKFYWYGSSSSSRTFRLGSAANQSLLGWRKTSVDWRWIRVRRSARESSKKIWKWQSNNWNIDLWKCQT